MKLNPALAIAAGCVTAVAMGTPMMAQWRNGSYLNRDGLTRNQRNWQQNNGWSSGDYFGPERPSNRNTLRRGNRMSGDYFGW